MNKLVSASNYCVKVFDGTHDTPKPSKNGKPLITSKNIIGSRLDLTDTYLISEADYNAVQRRSSVNQWDVLFSMIGSVGDVYLERSDEIPYAIKNVGVFSCEDEYRAKWLYYYLKSPYAQKFIDNYLSGAVQKFLPLGLLREFPIPDYSENFRPTIDLLDSIDLKIELNSKINQYLESIIKLIYDYWFVQFDFPDENGKPYKSTGGKMVWNDELKREIPEGWRESSISDIGDIVSGSTPSKNNKDYFSDSGIPWITPNDLSENTGNKFISRGQVCITEKGLKSASLKVMPKGTVLLTSRAPVGYLAISRNDVTTNQGFKSFVPKDYFTTPYIYYTLQTFLPTIINNSSGSTFKEISATMLKLVNVWLPPEDLVNKFTNSVIEIFRKQDLLEQENEQLASLREWLLPMLMNGQVSVKAIDEIEEIKSVNFSIPGKTAGLESIV